MPMNTKGIRRQNDSSLNINCSVRVEGGAARQGGARVSPKPLGRMGLAGAEPQTRGRVGLAGAERG